jgi:phenylacetate-CoA ligase
LRGAFAHLPPALRGAAATAWGAYLRAWRYGPELEDLVAQAVERESWSEPRWRLWREERVAALLHRAATTVPFYREAWARRRARGDHASWERLENWPLLEKETLRASPEAFVAEDRRRAFLFPEHTSGTTGTPLRLWWSRSAVRDWYALFEARVRRWNGVRVEDPWAMLGGQIIVPVERRRPPFWVWNGAMRQLYLSTYHLDVASAASYLAAMRERSVRYVLGYSSALATLAGLAQEQGLTAPALSVAIANAEPLLDSQRRTITASFGCEVRETYGMAEQVASASECVAGRLHEWPEVSIVEVLSEEGRAVEAGTSGRLVGTGLLNADMPLIRYVTGDRLSRPAAASPCACGRALPAFGSVEGRNDDLLTTPDGRIVGRLDPVFKGDLPLREAQIAQTDVDRVAVRIVPAAGYREGHGEEIARRLRERLGERMRVEVHVVDRVARTKAGKFRAVVREVGAEPPGRR